MGAAPEGHGARPPQPPNPPPQPEPESDEPEACIEAASGTRFYRRRLVGVAPLTVLSKNSPPGPALPLVITVQTDALMNFDRPAPIFPRSPIPHNGRLSGRHFQAIHLGKTRRSMP